MKAVVLMSRIPVPGHTKTRLIGALTPEQAATVHRAFLKDIGSQLTECGEDTTPFLYLGNEGPAGLALDVLPDGVEVIHQLSTPLGERMQHLFEQLFARGFESVVLFGADVPEIQESDLRLAQAALVQSDIVFGPTLDGGFYLIGMNRLHDAVFSPDIAWGTSAVYRQSVEQIGQQIRVAEVRQLRDMDDIDDLLALHNTPGAADACPESAAVVQHLLERKQWTA